MTEDRFLRVKEVAQMTAISTTQIYRLIERDEFPKQKRLSHRVAVWKLSEIQAWMEQRHAH